MNLDPATFDKLNVAWASTTTDEAYLALCARMGLEQIAREGLEKAHAAQTHAACASTPCAVCAAHNASVSADAAARMAALLAEGLPVSTDPHDADCPCDACTPALCVDCCEYPATDNDRCAPCAAAARYNTAWNEAGCPDTPGYTRIDWGYTYTPGTPGNLPANVAALRETWLRTLAGSGQKIGQTMQDEIDRLPATPDRCVCGRPYADCPDAAEQCAQEASKIAACRAAERIAQPPSYAGMTCLSPYSQAEQEKFAADNARCNALRQENWEGECADMAAANAARAAAHAPTDEFCQLSWDAALEREQEQRAHWAAHSIPFAELEGDAPTPTSAPSTATPPQDGPTPQQAYADAVSRRDAAYAAWEQAHLAGDWNSSRLLAIYNAAHQEATNAEVAAIGARLVAERQAA